MSVEIITYLVDWKILVQKWQENQTLDFWYNALDEEEDWIHYYDVSLPFSDSEVALEAVIQEKGIVISMA
ncbi:MAG: hypothetical protein QNJ33_11065 [Crocosphaera sp.]|nr:hypothetical protein [Crocosphaera sp.]